MDEKVYAVVRGDKYNFGKRKKKTSESSILL